VYTSYSPCITTVIEHALSRGRFPLISVSHQIISMGIELNYSVDVSDDADVASLMDLRL